MKCEIDIAGLVKRFGTTTVLAGIDLCLHLVRRDHGTAVANAVARHMVVPPWRDGGQAQFIERHVPRRVDETTGDVRTWAQAHLPPTRTALIMSMEPVFASLFAVWLGGEDLTGRLLLGGSMVLAAMLIVELAPRRVVEGEVPHIAV